MNLPPTDEKLERRQPKERDFDTQMLFGCSGFVVVSFTTYFLCVWPFLVWLNVEQIERLGFCLSLGFLPSYVLGYLASKKFELPGAGGFVGGLLASSIFLYLRFEQAFLEAQARHSPWPEYPRLFQWAVPLALVLLAVLVAGIAMLSSKEIQDFR